MEDYRTLIGKVKKHERKLLVTKPDQIEKLIKDLISESYEKCIETYEIEQFYTKGKKYRRVITQTQSVYTEHVHTFNESGYKEVEIGTISEATFTELRDQIQVSTRKIRKSIYLTHYKVYFTLDTYIKPYQDLQIVEVWSTDGTDPNNFPVPEWLVDVTGDMYFKDKSLLEGSLKSHKVVLEGTDFVGKTTLARYLVHLGYWVQDREMKNISGLVLPSVPLDKRATHMSTLSKNQSTCYIIMVNRDQVELYKRMLEREKHEPLSDFDREANLYNLMYEETLLYMEYKNILPSNMFRLDCTYKDVQEVYKEACLILDKLDGGI